MGDILEILFVRHGQTDWNKENKIQGSSDTRLNEVGLAQAKAAHKLFNDNVPDLIIASPLTRTLQTAEAIAFGRNIPIFTDERIKERSFGKYEGQKSFGGRTFNSLWYPSELPDDTIEPLDSFVDRVAEAFRDIKRKYSDKTVLVVSHGGVSIAASILIDKTPQNKNSKELYIDNCVVMRYDISKI